MKISEQDLQIIKKQLGRTPRDLIEVAYRGACGNPVVVKTKPKLENGTPFPTLYYATCPALNSALGTLESVGFMKELEQKLLLDQQLKDNYQNAHESYLKEREALEVVPEITGISAGGMPNRVKCLHALTAHSLAKGPGVNLIGDLALNKLKNWCESPCVMKDELN